MFTYNVPSRSDREIPRHVPGLTRQTCHDGILAGPLGRSCPVARRISNDGCADVGIQKSIVQCDAVLPAVPNLSTVSARPSLFVSRKATSPAGIDDTGPRCCRWRLTNTSPFGATTSCRADPRLSAKDSRTDPLGSVMPASLFGHVAPTLPTLFVEPQAKAQVSARKYARFFICPVQGMSHALVSGQARTRSCQSRIRLVSNKMPTRYRSPAAFHGYAEV
jgi:hypothetical protein